MLIHKNLLILWFIKTAIKPIPGHLKMDHKAARNLDFTRRVF